MNDPHFVPSTLHVVANTVDVSQDLVSEQNKSIGELLEEKNQEENSTTTTLQCGRNNISEHS